MDWLTPFLLTCIVGLVAYIGKHLLKSLEELRVALYAIKFDLQTEINSLGTRIAVIETRFDEHEKGKPCEP